MIPVLALAAEGVYWFLFMRPYNKAENAPSHEIPTLHEAADGSLTLSWGEGTNAEEYIVRLTVGGEVYWSGRFTGTSCEIPVRELPEGAVLRIYTSHSYSTPSEDGVRVCEKPMEVNYPSRFPDITGLAVEANPNGTARLTWDTVEGGLYTVYDARGGVIARTREGELTVTFGKDVPMPDKRETYTFSVSAGLEGTGVNFSSDVRKTVGVLGEDLRSTVLTLNMEDLGNNYYTFTWNETRGEKYELQERLGEEWSTLAGFTDNMPRSYTVGPLKSNTRHVIRVVALGGQTLEDGVYAAEPDGVTFTTGATVMYATIWPLKDLDIYSDPRRTEKVGTASEKNSYCVVGEENGMFLIYYGGGRGYIDSTFCLINLPDYLGDLCEYDIKNSYDAIYMVHGYGLSGITGTVITGYEEVASDYVPGTAGTSVRGAASSDGIVWDDGAWENGDLPVASTDPRTPDTEFVNGLTEIYTGESPYGWTRIDVRTPTKFLVPLLYPTAKKIALSAARAQELGYRLKIYDAYRPYKATRMLFDTTEQLGALSLPPYEYRFMEGAMWADYQSYLEASAVPDGAEVWSEATAFPLADIFAAPRDTVLTAMTDNGSWGLGSFLARSGSTHNQGVAVDLTLVDIGTGEELKMQTAMHDLSYHSIIRYNNEEAKLLAEIMTGSGLGTLVSEWWHFQDDELRDSTDGLVLRKEGVTRAGWTTDGAGWRYRTADGDYLRDGEYTVDGVSYTFDGNGFSNYTAWELPGGVMDFMGAE